MAKSALEEYLEIVEHESHSLESYLLGRNEAILNGTVDPEVRHYVEKLINDFKKQCRNLTTDEIKALSARLARKGEQDIIKIRNEKPEERDKKQEASGGGPQRKMMGKGPADKDKIEGSVTQQTKENSTIKEENRKSTITRGGIGGTGATAASGGQVRLKGATSRKGPVTADEQAASRLRGMQNEIKRGGPGARKTGKPDSALDQARRLKAIQKDNNRNNKQFAKKALEDLQQEEKDQKALQAGITADLVARGVISGQKPLTDAEIAKKAAKESAAEVAGIDKRHQEIQDAIKREEANKRLAGLRRTMPQRLPGDDEEIEEIGIVSDDRGAGTQDRRALPGNPNAEPERPTVRVGGRNVPVPQQQAASDGDDDDDNNDNRRVRRPKKNRGMGGKKIPDFLKNPLSGAGGMKMGMVARAAAFFATPAGWITIAVIVIIFIIIIIVGSYEDELQKENEARLREKGVTETLTIRKEKVNPPQLTAVPGETITFNIIVTDSQAAQEIVVVDHLPEGVSLADPEIISSWTKRTYDPASKTVTWKATENMVPGSLSAAPNFTITISYKVVANNLHLITWAEANPIRGGGAAVGNWVAPSDSLCGGKYDRAVQRNPLNKNFGDPMCNFTKDLLYTQLQQADPANADLWFNKIVPCESGYNPNAYAGHAQIGTPDAAGAWGLYQMGSATPPGSPPPAPGKNGPNDRGDVNWEIQTQNAVAYGKKIGNLRAYWACAR